MEQLEKEIQKLRKWACYKADYCHDCEYVIQGDENEYDDWCPFVNVIKAAEDRGKEVQNNGEK